MLKKITFLMSLSGVCAIAQTVTVVDSPSNDIVYSSYSQRFYFSVPGNSAGNASTLAQLNPGSGQVETFHAIGNDPGVLAISSNGEKLYIGLQSAPGVAEFDVTTNTPGALFTLGSDAANGAYYAEDIEVMPSNPNTVAVARRNLNYAPKHEGVAIFDSGVMRPNTTADHTGSNQIEFSSASEIVGFNNETTEHRFKKIGVSSGGTVALAGNATGLPAAVGGASTFSVHDAKAYFINGTVVDFMNAPMLSSNFDAFGPAVFDAATGAIVYASYDMGGNISLRFYNPTLQSFIGSVAVPQVTGSVKRFAVSGTGFYAFTTQDKVVLVSNALGNPSPDMQVAMIYPNPATDELYITGIDSATPISIYNQLGQEVLKAYAEPGMPLNVDSLAAGSYFLKIDAPAGTMTQKLVKL